MLKPTYGLVVLCDLQVRLTGQFCQARRARRAHQQHARHQGLQKAHIAAPELEMHTIGNCRGLKLVYSQCAVHKLGVR
jgi:hypothetical protein